MDVEVICKPSKAMNYKPSKNKTLYVQNLVYAYVSMLMNPIRFGTLISFILGLELSMFPHC